MAGKIPTFCKRSGTTDAGKGYEEALVTLVAFNLSHSEEIEDFELSSNDSKFGSFDDVVVKIFLTNGGVKNFALQLKHSQNTKKIALNSLAASKGEFSLQKYFDSFKKLDFLKNFDLILYTNKFLDINQQVIFSLESKEYFKIEAKSYNCFDNDFFDTSPRQIKSVVKFDIVGNGGDETEESEISDYRNFFRKFSLYVNQQNVTEMKLSFSKLFDNIYVSDDASSGFLRFVKNWCQLDGFKEVINKQNTRLKICEILLSPFLTTIILTTTANNDSLQRLSAIMYQFEVAILENLDDLSNLYFIDENINDDEMKKINQVGKRFGITSKKIEHIDELKDFDRRRIFWHLNKAPFVVKVSNFNKPLIIKALTLCQGQRRFILLGKIDKTELAGIKVFQDLSDIDINDENYQKMIENILISLQGRKHISLKNLIDLDNDFRNIITLKDLTKISCFEQLSSGKNDKLLPCYVERSLSKILISFDFIRSLSSDLSVVSCCGKFDNIKQILDNTISIDIEEFLIDNDIFIDSDPRSRFFYHRGCCTEKQFEDLSSKYQDRNCHHFRLTEENNLEWIKTNGRIENLKKFQYDFEEIKESEIIDLVPEKLKIICGEAGIGKSVMASYLKNNISSDTWIFSVKSRDFFPKLKNEGVDKIVDFLCQNQDCSEIDNKIRSIFVEKKKMTILWDGLDELDKNLLDFALKVVKMLSKIGTIQWIFARSYLKNVLESELNVFASTIKELSEEQQKKYVMQRLSDRRKEEIEEVSKRIFDRSRRRGFFAIPLHLYMLTELLNRDSEKYFALLEDLFSLADMYNFFLEEKLNFYFAKSNFDSSNSITQNMFEENISFYKELCEMLSLKLYLEEVFDNIYTNEIATRPLDKFIEKIKFEGDKTGFLIHHHQSENQLPNFTHETFGEYFLALWLSKHHKYVKNLTIFFLEEKFDNVRLLFDMIVAKNCYAHLAVLNRNFDTLVKYENEILTKDGCGRSPLHLACSWGQRHNLLNCQIVDGKYLIDLRRESQIGEFDKEGMKILEKLIDRCDLFEGDVVFGWNCLDYAVYTLSFQTLNFLMGKVSNTKSLLLSKFEDICSVTYYTVKLDYQNLIDIIENIPYFEDKTTNENLLHVVAQLDNANILTKLVKIKEYRAAIDNRFIKENSFDTANLTYRLNFTPLDIAIWRGNSKIVKLLLDNQASVNNFDNERNGALHLAADMGRTEIVKLLLSNGANVNVKNKLGLTPLILACTSRNTEIVKILLDVNADDFGLEFDNLDSSHLQSLICTLKFKNVPNVDSILSSIPLLFVKMEQYSMSLFEQKSIRQFSGLTLTHIACLQNNFEVVKILPKLSFDNTSIFGLSPLHCAALSGSFEIVKFLVENGVNVNAVDKNGSTVLHYACVKDNFEIVKFLIEHDVLIDEKNINGHTASHAATLRQSLPVLTLLLDNGASLLSVCRLGLTLLHYASLCGCFEIVKFLVKKGVSIDSSDINGRSPLLCACAIGSSEIVKFLLQNGARIDSFDKDGATGLHFACLKGHLDVVACLIEAHASIERRNFNGQTALHTASFSGFLNILQFLIEKGGDFRAVDKMGLTVLHYAILGRHMEVVKFLVGRFWGDLGEKSDQMGLRPLHYAASFGLLEIVGFLVGKGADLRAVDKRGRSFEDLARMKGHSEVLKLIKN